MIENLAVRRAIEILRNARIARGWTMERTGDAFGVTKSHISRWEAMAHAPSSEALARWATSLGYRLQLVPIDELEARHESR